VPLFFASAGYFAYKQDAPILKKRIIHILKLIAFAEAIYLIYKLLNDPSAAGMTVASYSNIATWLRILFYNLSPGSYHLWYLFALLFVYVIHLIVSKLKVNEVIVFVVAFGLLAANLICGEFMHLFGIRLLDGYFCSYYLAGIPFFYLGMFFNKHKEGLRKIPLALNVILIVLGAILSIVSRQRYGLCEEHLGSILILLALMSIAIGFEKARYPKWVNTLSACSTNIYIFHIIVYNVVWQNALASKINVWSVEYQMIQPILVCIISLLISLLLNLARAIIKSKIAR
jgi:peptidoglycan/LPS O-acetylase OafA/YrhL